MLEFLLLCAFGLAGIIGLLLGFLLLTRAIPPLYVRPPWTDFVGFLMGASYVWAVWALSDYVVFILVVGVLILGYVLLTPGDEDAAWARMELMGTLPAGARRPRSVSEKGARRPRSVLISEKGKRKRRRAGWIEKWARIHSAALGTSRWRRPRLRRGRFGLRPNPVRCAVCTRRPCVCNVAELGRRGGASIVGVRGAVEQSASEGLGGEPAFRRTFRGGGAGSGRRPAGF